MKNATLRFLLVGALASAPSAVSAGIIFIPITDFQIEDAGTLAIDAAPEGASL
jgi:hypothetical protein